MDTLGSQHDEDELFLTHVVQDDHELFYLDVCMSEICRAMQEEGL